MLHCDFFSSAAGFHPAELIVYVTDVSVCLCVIILFSNHCSSYSFSVILTKLGTHDPCAYMQKNSLTDFENFDC